MSGLEPDADAYSGEPRQVQLTADGVAKGLQGKCRTRWGTGIIGKGREGCFIKVRRWGQKRWLVYNRAFWKTQHQLLMEAMQDFHVAHMTAWAKLKDKAGRFLQQK